MDRADAYHLRGLGNVRGRGDFVCASSACLLDDVHDDLAHALGDHRDELKLFGNLRGIISRSWGAITHAAGGRGELRFFVSHTWCVTGRNDRGPRTGRRQG
jgi:hypothetical protein